MRSRIRNHEFCVKHNQHDAAIKDQARLGTRLIWAVFHMMSLEEIQERAALKIAELRLRRHWSYKFMSDEIGKVGGAVSAKTIENIEKCSTNYEFAALYWIARVLNLSIGELMEFSVESTDARAHAQLASILKMDAADRNYVLTTLRYLTLRAAITKKSHEGA